MITATIVCYSDSNYGAAQHYNGRQVYFTEKELRENVRNAESVLARKGARHIAMERDTKIAFQVSGYSWNRGSYCDVLPLEEMMPYMKQAKSEVNQNEISCKRFPHPFLDC